MYVSICRAGEVEGLSHTMVAVSLGSEAPAVGVIHHHLPCMWFSTKAEVEGPVFGIGSHMQNFRLSVDT